MAAGWRTSKPGDVRDRSARSGIGNAIGRRDLQTERTIRLAEDCVQFFRQTGEVGRFDGGQRIGPVGQPVETAEQAVLQLGDFLLVAGGGEDRQAAAEGIGSILQAGLSRSRHRQCIFKLSCSVSISSLMSGTASIGARRTGWMRGNWLLQTLQGFELFGALRLRQEGA